MQRHLATRPGWLEWAWRAEGSAFETGAAQRAAWSAARLDARELPPLPALDPDELGLEPPALRAIGNVCDSFIRVSPTNLVFSGLLRWRLSGPPERPGSSSAVASPMIWTPPPMLPALPPLRAPEDLDPLAARALAVFTVDVAGERFVPGLYRMLAHWPRLLETLARELGPRLDDGRTVAACAALAARIDGAVPAVLARLTPAPEPPVLTQVPAVLDALERYRVTSPQMVVYGTLVRSALGLGGCS